MPRVYISSVIEAPAAKVWERVRDRCSEDIATPARPAPPLDLRPEIGKEAFIGMVARAKEYIAAGDIYQVNLARAFSAPWDPNREPFSFYLALAACSPAPYAAYLKLFVVTFWLCGICLALPTAESPLYKAVQAGAPVDEVVALLREGADPEDGLRVSVPLVGGLLRAQTPLYHAVGQGNTAAVEALLEAGARPEAGETVGPLGALLSGTPLYRAAE